VRLDSTPPVALKKGPPFLPPSLPYLRQQHQIHHVLRCRPRHIPREAHNAISEPVHDRLPLLRHPYSTQIFALGVGLRNLNLDDLVTFCPFSRCGREERRERGTEGGWLGGEFLLLLLLVLVLVLLLVLFLLLLSLASCNPLPPVPASFILLLAFISFMAALTRLSGSRSVTRAFWREGRKVGRER